MIDLPIPPYNLMSIAALVCLIAHGVAYVLVDGKKNPRLALSLLLSAVFWEIVVFAAAYVEASGKWSLFGIGG